MQFSGFFLQKCLFCFDQLFSFGVQADDELAILAFNQYRISDMETGSFQPLSDSIKIVQSKDAMYT